MENIGKEEERLIMAITGFRTGLEFNLKNSSRKFSHRGQIFELFFPLFIMGFGNGHKTFEEFANLFKVSTLLSITQYSNEFIVGNLPIYYVHQMLKLAFTIRAKFEFVMNKFSLLVKLQRTRCENAVFHPMFLERFLMRLEQHSINYSNELDLNSSKNRSSVHVDKKCVNDVDLDPSVTFIRDLFTNWSFASIEIIDSLDFSISHLEDDGESDCVLIELFDQLDLSDTPKHWTIFLKFIKNQSMIKNDEFWDSECDENVFLHKYLKNMRVLRHIFGQFLKYSKYLDKCGKTNQNWLTDENLNLLHCEVKGYLDDLYLHWNCFLE
jgi:hypothetical protein